MKLKTSSGQCHAGSLLIETLLAIAIMGFIAAASLKMISAQKKQVEQQDNTVDLQAVQEARIWASTQGDGIIVWHRQF